MPTFPPNSPSGSWTHQLDTSSFPIQRDRYHLYIGLFCPFAHRALIVRQLKGLQDILPLSVVHPYPKEPNGWHFPATNEEYEGATVDHLYGSKYLRELYFTCDPHYQGKYSVPMLWDKKAERIVNNESEDIMRMLCWCFDDFLDDEERKGLDFYPVTLRERIDEVSAWMGPGLNSGVYRAGFADTQEDYEKNARMVFETLDRLEKMSKESGTLFVLGSKMTTVDIKLYTTLVRFDVIYQQHFKLMLRSIRHGYPNLHRWLKDMYWNVPGVKETTNFRHIKDNYSRSHPGINPKSITPLGPEPEVEPWTAEDAYFRQLVILEAQRMES